MTELVLAELGGWVAAELRVDQALALADSGVVDVLSLIHI